MLRNVLGQGVRTLEGDTLIAVLGATVDVVLRRENVLRLRDGHVKMQGTAVRAQADLLRVDAAVADKPGVYSIDGLLGRTEDLGDLRGCPVLSIVRGLRIRHFEEELVKLVEVGLC